MKRGLTKLLRRSWLEGAVDAYLESIVDSGQETGLIHASWLLSSEEEIYQRLVDPGPPGKIHAKLRRMFDDGIDLQRRYISYFRGAGILYEPEGWDEERGVRVVDEKYGIVGHIDALIRTPEEILVPVELKAYNSQLFKRFRYHPRIEHYHQLQMYLYLWDAPYGYLLPENKDDQSMNPLKVFRDEEMINTALSKATTVWNKVKEDLNV